MLNQAEFRAKKDATIAKFKSAFGKVMNKVVEAGNLGIKPSPAVTQALVVITRIVQIIDSIPAHAELKRLEYAVAEMDKILDFFRREEYKFYTALVTALALHAKIELLDVHHPNVRRAFVTWDELRKTKPEYAAVRKAYLAVVSAIDTAEAQDFADRIRIGLNLEKPVVRTRRTSHRSAKDAARRKAMKGSNAEIPNKGGTSRKVVAKHRKRARLAR